MRKFIYFTTINLFLLYCHVISASEYGTVDADIIVIHSPQEFKSRQNLPYFLGISSASAGSRILSMNLVIIPPGAMADAHYHDGYESAIYLIQGKVETKFGPNLQKSVINQAGDFIFIPPNVPHQPRNLSETEPAIAIVARNDPNEQESVIPHNITKD